MNHKELVASVAEQLSLSQTKANTVVRTILDAILTGVMEEGEVRVAGFGTFELVERAARVARNPQTGETIEVPAHKAFKFRPASAVKNLVREL